MILSVLSSQVKKGVEDFLKTTFPVSTPFFHGVMDRFLGEDGGVFKGPYLSIKLPYRTSSIGLDFFPGIPLFFPPYRRAARGQVYFVCIWNLLKFDQIFIRQEN